MWPRFERARLGPRTAPHRPSVAHASASVWSRPGYGRPSAWAHVRHRRRVASASRPRRRRVIATAPSSVRRSGRRFLAAGCAGNGQESIDVNVHTKHLNTHACAYPATHPLTLPHKCNAMQCNAALVGSQGPRGQHGLHQWLGSQFRHLRRASDVPLKLQVSEHTVRQQGLPGPSPPEQRSPSPPLPPGRAYRSGQGGVFWRRSTGGRARRLFYFNLSQLSLQQTQTGKKTGNCFVEECFMFLNNFMFFEEEENCN